MNNQYEYDNIDVVMTATLRPEIIDLTLLSFSNKFLNQFKNTRLIINIDPIGDEKCAVEDVLNVCKKYFDVIIVNTPNTPSFPKAVKWCWEQIESEYFLHLEDDWLLKKELNKENIFKLFKNDISISSIRFFLSTNKKLNMDENYVYSGGFSLNPSIIKKSFINILLQRFDTNKDPEKQFSDLKNLTQYKFIVYGSSKDGYYTIDIGKKWRNLKQFNKPNITESKNKTWDKNNFKFSIKNYLNYKIYMSYWRLIAK